MVQAGARVIVADVADDPCKARVAELKKLGGKADYCLVDVTSRQSIENLLAKSIDLAGRVHILVNCAGVNAGTNFLDATDADWDRILTINLRGVFQACQVFGRHMIEQGGGSIVNIGSVTSHLPLIAGVRLFGLEGGRAEPVAKHRPRFRPKRRARQRNLPGLLPGRTKPQTSYQGARGKHHEPHAHETFRRTRGVGRRIAASGIAQGRQFHHRCPHQRRRRIHRRVVVKNLPSMKVKRKKIFMSINPKEIIFTPENEPYLGRELLFHFDKVICSCLEENAKIAPKTHEIALTDLQESACQLIPQAISIALSIRELIRQGYLFGAFVLVRPLVERAVILLYLNEKPSEIEKWKSGWRYNEAPSLAKMIEYLESTMDNSITFKAHQVTATLNSILHGKPDSGICSLTPLSDSAVGHAPSKQLQSPDLCDEVCAHVIPWLVCVQCMMGAFFPELSSG